MTLTSQIERAHVSDLDWAFAYMGGSGSGAKRPKTAKKQAGVQWVYEEEAKKGKDYVRILKKVCMDG